MRRALTVSIPTEEVAAMLDLLNTLRAGEEEDDPVLDELVRAADAHGGSRTPLELSGPAGLIRDAAYGLLLDGVDALADACRSYEAGMSSLVELVEAGESAARRLALMRRVEQCDGWSAD